MAGLDKEIERKTGYLYQEDGGGVERLSGFSTAILLRL
jgi:hypothetical protein